MVILYRRNANPIPSPSTVTLRKLKILCELGPDVQESVSCLHTNAGSEVTAYNFTGSTKYLF